MINNKATRKRKEQGDQIRGKNGQIRSHWKATKQETEVQLRKRKKTKKVVFKFGGKRLQRVVVSWLGHLDAQRSKSRKGNPLVIQQEVIRITPFVQPWVKVKW